MNLRPAQRRTERGEIELLRGLVRLGNELQASIDLEAVVQTIAAAMAETFQFREATVFIREPDAAIFRAHATVGQDPEVDRRVLETLVPAEVFLRLFQERFQIGRSNFIDHREYEMDAADEAYFPAPDIGERPEGEWHQDDTLFVPLYDRHGKLAAVLDLYDPADRRLPSLDLIKPLEVFATHAAVALENARHYEELQRASAALEEQLRVRHELLALSEVLLSTLDQRAVFEQTSTLLKEMVDYETLDIRLVDEERRELVAIYARDTNADEMLDYRIPLDQGLTGWVVRHNQAQLVNDAGSDPRGVLVPGTEPEPQASIVVPLQVRGKVIGVLSMDRLGGRTFDERELEPVRLFANLAAIAIQNARAFMEMEVQAISDGLTGIHNHRHFQETLRASVSRAGRYDETFCLLMMDLDHFKAVNDTVGHQQGDEVLRSVAGALRRCSRDSDYLARYGGEEFVMLLPQTSLVEARNMAERICTQVRRIEAGAPDLSVSMSIGVASFPDSAADSDGVLHAADAALLRAKARGRNRVCLYTEEQLAHTTLDGRLVNLGRRFARQIGLSEEETGGLITALAVSEVTGAMREEVRAVLGRAQDVTAAAEDAAAPAADVRSSAYNALLYGSEHWDGTGYPNGLRGERIPRVARAFAVCREYGEVGDHETVNGSRLAKLRAKAARELDPRMVQRFTTLMREAKAATPGEPKGEPRRSA